MLSPSNNIGDHPYEKPLIAGSCQAVTASTVASVRRAWSSAHRSAVFAFADPSTPTIMRRSCSLVRSDMSTSLMRWQPYHRCAVGTAGGP